MGILGRKRGRPITLPVYRVEGRSDGFYVIELVSNTVAAGPVLHPEASRVARQLTDLRGKRRGLNAVA